MHISTTKIHEEPSNAVGYLSSHSGASRGRDAVDTAYINDLLTSGTSGNSAGGIVKNVPAALWGVTTPSVAGPTDSDADGMADIWEESHASLSMLPWKDIDGDGWTNLEEYLNGTNPSSGNDPMLDQSSEITGNLSTK
jgi:hypothetical protein